MAKKRHTAEQIISKLREAEVLLGKGTKMPQVCRKIEITEQTYYRWRKEYGGRASAGRCCSAMCRLAANMARVTASSSNALGRHPYRMAKLSNHRIIIPVSGRCVGTVTLA